jgi:hypothetical protein
MNIELTKIKPGQQILIDNPFMKDAVMVCICKCKEDKYPITNNDGVKQRSLGFVLPTKEGDTGSIKFVSAKDEGCNPDDKIDVYDFIGSFGDSLTIKENEAEEIIKSFNIRLINKKHPKYDPTLNKYGKGINDMFKTMFKGKIDEN